MKPDPLDALLEKLCRGDAAAAQEVFVAYEPYLRMVVRRLMPPQLRAKFDSRDVVQSVWADMLQGFRDGGWRFANAAQLRAFLIKVTRNRFIDRVRRYRQAVKYEHSLDQITSAQGMAAGAPRPSEFARANDLWEQMVALCPPAHQQLLWWKRQGYSLAEIADRTGLHPSSVRRVLYDLARALAAKQTRDPAATDLDKMLRERANEGIGL
jgi:RNA polymerase sigma-70 factor (ECF subfamily)